MGKYQLQTNNCRYYVKKAYKVIQTFRLNVYWETLGRRSDLTYTMDDIMKLGSRLIWCWRSDRWWDRKYRAIKIVKKGNKAYSKEGVGSAVKRVTQQVMGKVTAQSRASFVVWGSTAIGFGVASTIISVALTVASVASGTIAALGFLSGLLSIGKENKNFKNNSWTKQ